MSTSTQALDLQDKRHARGRFSWVKRLVQGQNRTEPVHSSRYDNNLAVRFHSPADDNTRKSIRSVEFVSDDESVSMHSDNISTTPLKSIMSHASTTHSPSVISNEQQQDAGSGVASTAETSLAPSVHLSLASATGPVRLEERDSESIVTLASSSRRMRRRSIDTNCSMAGIPPASIMERLQVRPETHEPEHTSHEPNVGHALETNAGDTNSNETNGAETNSHQTNSAETNRHETQNRSRSQKERADSEDSRFMERQEK